MKPDEVFSADSPWAANLQRIFLPCCCHQNSNYMQAGKMYTFSSNTIYNEQLYKDLMSWLLPWICWCSCFSCYCLFKPSWIKRTVFIFTAWCCIISIIQKPCAHNLILSIIFMAAEHAQENVETLAFLSPLCIICGSFVINLVDLVGEKKTMFVVHVRIQIKLLYSNLLENTELYTVEHGDTYCGHQRAPMHHEKMGVPVKESKKENANEFSCNNYYQNNTIILFQTPLTFSCIVPGSVYKLQAGWADVSFICSSLIHMVFLQFLNCNKQQGGVQPEISGRINETVAKHRKSVGSCVS